MKHEAAVLLSAFLSALKAAQKKGRGAFHGMGLYGVAMAAGQPALGGFAPVAGTVGRAVDEKFRVAGAVGDACVAVARPGAVQAGTGSLAAQPGRGDARESFHAIMATARSEAAVARARREAGRAGLHLPARGVALEGRSFAPVAGVAGVAAGDLLRTPRGLGEAASGVRRGVSVHGAVAVAEAGAGVPGGDESESFTTVADHIPALAPHLDLERALENYFFRQSRLPPAGGAGFNPLLSPVWAGLKLPG